MALQQTMQLITRLLSRAQALSALTAHLRLMDMQQATDPALRFELDRVVDGLQARRLTEELSPEERAVLIGFARSYLRQALDLVEQPDRPGAWAHDDPTLLQAQGAASAVVASLFIEAGIGKPGARILDVGTGVARLAIAFCEAYPNATVVGLDPWEPALAIARRSIADAGLGSRITLSPIPVERFHDQEGFDVVWLPSFFIPELALDAALNSIRGSTRPGGVVVVGTRPESDDGLASAIDDLMTVRSGGTPLTAAAAIARLERTGFVDVREIPRTWQAPLGLAVGYRN
jgi:SAM-dependent methyltransferase